MLPFRHRYKGYFLYFFIDNLKKLSHPFNMCYPTTDQKLKQLLYFLPLKYSQFSKVFPISTLYIHIIITILLAIFFSCNRDQTYIERGFEKEKQGNIAEALHSYNQAFKINPDNKVANERIGFLLSESQFSIIPAIYHLENARSQDPKSTQIPLKLIDLTLFISDFSKAKRIQKEISNQLPNEMNELLTLVTGCLETNQPKDKAKIIEILSQFPLSEDTHWIYRSLALCYETGGDSLKAEEIASKYKKQESNSQ